MDHGRPNILFISVDSLRADQVSFCSNIEGTTPYLDELANYSTVFKRSISPTIWTLPSHASFFTGCYPPEHGVIDEGYTLGDTPTIGELLAERGYDTRSFGYLEWFQLGGILRGFDHTVTSLFREGDLKSTNPRRVADQALDLLGNDRWRVLEFVRSLTFSDLNRSDNRTVDAVLNAASTTSRPFCHFVHLNTVHWPYTPPSPYYRLFGDHSRRALVKNRSYWQQRIYFNRGKIATGEITPPDTTVDRMLDQYRGAVRQADAQIRRLLSGLDDIVGLENTIIVVFGDHGDNIGEDGLFGHHFSVSDELIRVPLLVHDPTSSLTPGVRSDVVQPLDVYQTLMDILDIDIDRANSESLLDKDNRKQAFVYYDPPSSFVKYVSDNVENIEQMAAPRYCVWESPENKVVWKPNSDTYEESNNSRLRDALRDHYANLVQSSFQDDEAVSAQVRRRLGQLGYL